MTEQPREYTPTQVLKAAFNQEKYIKMCLDPSNPHRRNLLVNHHEFSRYADGCEEGSATQNYFENLGTKVSTLISEVQSGHHPGFTLGEISHFHNDPKFIEFWLGVF